jgi:hypothetical protein
MNRDLQAKMPLPVEVIEFDFLRNQQIASHVVLELRTATNPIRLFLTKSQLQELSSKAQIAASKLV